jgi:hypothetical protein
MADSGVEPGVLLIMNYDADARVSTELASTREPWNWGLTEPRHATGRLKRHISSGLAGWRAAATSVEVFPPVGSRA